jgi:hypothetical protein
MSSQYVSVIDTIPVVFTPDVLLFPRMEGRPANLLEAARWPIAAGTPRAVDGHCSFHVQKIKYGVCFWRLTTTGVLVSCE